MVFYVNVIDLVLCYIILAHNMLCLMLFYATFVVVLSYVVLCDPNNRHNYEQART